MNRRTNVSPRRKSGERTRVAVRTKGEGNNPVELQKRGCKGDYAVNAVSVWEEKGRQKTQTAFNEIRFPICSRELLFASAPFTKEQTQSKSTEEKTEGGREE